MLRLAAERTRQHLFESRVVRLPVGFSRLRRLDLGGSDIPALAAEGLGKQLQAFTVSGFDGLRLQAIA